MPERSRPSGTKGQRANDDVRKRGAGDAPSKKTGGDRRSTEMSGDPAQVGRGYLSDLKLANVFQHTSIQSFKL